jgi:hypothetical protein
MLPVFFGYLVPVNIFLRIKAIIFWGDLTDISATKLNYFPMIGFMKHPVQDVSVIVHMLQILSSEWNPVAYTYV